MCISISLITSSLGQIFESNYNKIIILRIHVGAIRSTLTNTLLVIKIKIKYISEESLILTDNSHTG